MIYRIIIDNHRQHLDFLSFSNCAKHIARSTSEDILKVTAIDYDWQGHAQIENEWTPEEFVDEYYAGTRQLLADMEDLGDEEIPQVFIDDQQVLNLIDTDALQQRLQ